MVEVNNVLFKMSEKINKRIDFNLSLIKEYNNEKIKSYDVKLNIELIEREQTFLIDLLQTGKE